MIKNQVDRDLFKSTELDLRELIRRLNLLVEQISDTLTKIIQELENA